MYPSSMYLEVIAAFQENTGEQNYIVKDTEETVRFFLCAPNQRKNSVWTSYCGDWGTVVRINNDLTRSTKHDTTLYVFLDFTNTNALNFWAHVHSPWRMHEILLLYVLIPREKRATCQSLQVHCDSRSHLLLFLSRTIKQKKYISNINC